MATWAIRPVLPAGAVYGGPTERSFRVGQMPFNQTDLQIPNTLKNYVESVSIQHASRYINKYTGFETKKYRIADTSGNDLDVNLSISLVGNLPRWLQNMFISLAKAINGAGMELEFYDDWITNKQYSGRWVNAVDFVDNSELLMGGSIDLLAWEMQAI